MTTAAHVAPTGSRVAHRALWALQILLGVFFIVASAAPKLVGEAYAVQIFTEIGAGEWFRHFIPAAVGLMALMIGAAYTQAVVLAEPVMVVTPAILFVLAAVIAWGRRASIVAGLPGRR
jgi:putative oxidoreductase